MYNIRHGGNGPSSRLNEILDQIRAEFDNQQSRSGEYESQSELNHNAEITSSNGTLTSLLSFGSDGGDGTSEEQNLCT